MADPATQLALQAKAYQDESFAVFQNDNWLQSGMRAALGTIANKGGAAGYAA